MCTVHACTLPDMYKPVQSNLFVLNWADLYVTDALLPIIIIIFRINSILD